MLIAVDSNFVSIFIDKKSPFKLCDNSLILMYIYKISVTNSVIHTVVIENN